MKWSLSTARMFNRCQRQWFYKALGNAKVKNDPLRRNLYLLGKLQSTSAWRGSLVDLAIERAVVPALRTRRIPQRDNVLRVARDLFERQLATARNHPLFEADFSPSQLGDAFAALHCVEYGDGITDAEAGQCWEEIQVALTNLLSMEEVLARLTSARYVIAQRSLHLQHSDVSILAVPDVIAFYADQPPLIVDWKAHAFGLADAWLQLAIYAITLIRGAPHSDFPAGLRQWREEDVELLEVQLMTNRVRKHDIAEQEILEAEAFIAASAESMLIASEGKKSSELSELDFSTANSPDTCARCAYRAICWGESNRWTSQPTYSQLLI
jgi:hypothetical protein